MPPVSRPTEAPLGTWNVPASLPSARRAVSVMLLTAGSAGAAGAGAAAAGRGAAEAPPSRNPQEPQNRFDGAFVCPHWGQTTVPAEAAGAATAGAAGGGGATCGAGACAGGGAATATGTW